MNSEQQFGRPKLEPSAQADTEPRECKPPHVAQGVAGCPDAGSFSSARKSYRKSWAFHPVPFLLPGHLSDDCPERGQRQNLCTDTSASRLLGACQCHRPVSGRLSLELSPAMLCADGVVKRSGISAGREHHAVTGRTFLTFSNRLHGRTGCFSLAFLYAAYTRLILCEIY